MAILGQQVTAIEVGGLVAAVIAGQQLTSGQQIGDRLRYAQRPGGQAEPLPNPVVGRRAEGVVAAAVVEVDLGELVGRGTEKTRLTGYAGQPSFSPEGSK